MRILLYGALLSTVLPQGCDLRLFSDATPEQIQQKAQAGLKPYFPQVTVAVDKRQQMLVGYTCTDLGKPLLEMMPKVLDEKPEVQQLKTYRSFAQLQSFALGFEQQVLYLDLASGRYFIVTAESLPGYVAGYQQNCNAVRSTTTPNTAGNPSPDNRVNLGEPIGGPVPVGGRGVTPPSVLTRVEPQYTEAARRARCQGTSVLNVVIKKDGTVDVLGIVRSSQCADLDESAIQTLKQWRFTPGMRDGIAVDVSMKIEVNFNLGKQR
jgi:TonB family protein